MHPELLQQRDEQPDNSAQEKKESRQDIPLPSILPGANWWETGRTYQLRVKELPMQEAGK